MLNQTFLNAISADLDAEMLAIRREQVPIAPILWEIVDYQFGWDVNDLAERRHISGKKIRPLLMALVAQAISGDYHHVLPAGAALEFLHNFTLIHDDVMDKSLERRHRPAVWTRWGTTQAVNAGDGLYALANLSSARLLDQGVPPRRVGEMVRAMSQACLWTAEGQMLDISFETRETVSTAEYITMITHKTGTLIEGAARIGALLTTDDEHVVQSYAQFGRFLGIAFQVRDDYLGVWGDEAQTGKSATGDIREKKKAYPFLAAFEHASAADRAALLGLYAQESLSDADVQTVLAIFNRAGAAEQTERVAADYYARALAHLDDTGVRNDTQDTIRQLAAFLNQRAY
jgi:geranylgeranyl pyrophosphate synthase